MLEEHSGGGRCATRTEADGSFELGGLLEREYELWVQAEVDGTRGGPWRVRAGRSEVVLRLEPEADTGPVSGRVLGLDGRPLVGVRVVPWRGASRDTYEHPPWLEETRARTTDADGRFSFPSFARTDTWLELRHPALFRPRFALDAAPDPTRLELTVPVLCEFELEPTPRSEACDALVVLDARGQELELCFASGEVTALLRTVPLRAGRSGVLRVPEDARTLVLRRGDEELLRLPLTLDPATRTRLAP